VIFIGSGSQNQTANAEKAGSVIHKIIHNVVAHFAQFYLEPIEGSTEKVNKIEFQSKNINGDIFF
jgi:hypothetical protein